MLVLQANSLASTVTRAGQALLRGDVLTAAELMAQNAGQVPGVMNSFRQTKALGQAIAQGNVVSYLAACFTGETEVLSEHGFIRFDRLTARDSVAADADRVERIANHITDKVADGPFFGLSASKERRVLPNCFTFSPRGSSGQVPGINGTQVAERIADKLQSSDNLVIVWAEPEHGIDSGTRGDGQETAVYGTDYIMSVGKFVWGGPPFGE